MIVAALAISLAMQAANPATTTRTTGNAASAPVTIEQETGTKLLAVRRIYVDSFGEDVVSRQIQAMVISSLGESKRFVVTENKDKADAVLKGTALEKTAQELHSYSDSTAAGHAGGAVSGGTGSVGAASAAISDSSTSTETIHNARAAVRLVDRDGDVIWATTQESKGAKYKGASADVADRIVKQLLQEIEKTEKKLSPPTTKP